MPHRFRLFSWFKKKVARVIRWCQRYGYQKILAGQKITLPKDSIVVSYGPVLGEQLGSGLALTGGKVKLTYLHKRYPHTKEDFNILYLVSSALSRYSTDIARWAKAQGVKVVLNQDGVAYPAWTGDHQRINSELKNVLNLADLVIYQSQFCKKTADYFLGVAPAIQTVMNNCVDVTTFCQRQKVISRDITLLVAGSHYQRERVTIPLHALKILRDEGVRARLIIAGPLRWPEADEEIRLFLQEHGLSQCVKMYGAFSYDDAPSIYARADILLHLKYKDPCPNVVIEAMACGLPTIGSNSGGLPELVGDCGILLPVVSSWDEMMYPTVANVCEAITELAESLMARQLAARNRAVVKFSSDRWLTKHDEWFQRLLES